MGSDIMCEYMPWTPTPTTPAPNLVAKALCSVCLCVCVHVPDQSVLILGYGWFLNRKPFNWSDYCKCHPKTKTYHVEVSSHMLLFGQADARNAKSLWIGKTLASRGGAWSHNVRRRQAPAESCLQKERSSRWSRKTWLISSMTTTLAILWCFFTTSNISSMLKGSMLTAMLPGYDEYCTWCCEWLAMLLHSSTCLHFVQYSSCFNSCGG